MEQPFSIDDVRIESVDMLNDEFVLVVFSNGQSVKLEAARLMKLALEEGSETVTNEEAEV